MKTNELRKGDRVRLESGWYATMADNLKGNRRMATVEGAVTETGSVYAHDIVLYIAPDGSETVIEHTPAQAKLRAQVNGGNQAQTSRPKLRKVTGTQFISFSKSGGEVSFKEVPIIRAFTYMGHDWSVVKGDNGYDVNHRATGASIGVYSHPTIDSAVDAATDRLDRAGQNRLDTAVKQFKHGPEYFGK